MYLSLTPCKDSQKIAIYTNNTVFLVKLYLKNIEPFINDYNSNPSIIVFPLQDIRQPANGRYNR